MLQKLKNLIADNSGAIVIEATVSLSVFMFAIVVVLSIVNICYAQMKMGVAVNQTAKELSQYGYLYDRMGLAKEQQELVKKGEESKNLIDDTTGSLVGIMDGMKSMGDTAKNVSIDNLSDSAKSISSNWKSIKDDAGEVKDNVSEVLDDPKKFALGLLALGGDTIVEKAKTQLLVVPFSKYMFKRTLKSNENADSEPFLQKLRIVPSGNSYIDGLDFSESCFCKDGKHEINVVVKYKIKVLDLLGNDITMNFVQHGKTTCWHPS